MVDLLLDLSKPFIGLGIFAVICIGFAAVFEWVQSNFFWR